MRGVLVAALILAVLNSGPRPREVDEMPFLRFRALVAQPDVVWQEWDVAIYGALEERGFEVSYGGSLADPQSLLGYDLVALNIKRRLTTAEVAVLDAYVSRGGALYASWGGPMGASDFMRDVLRASSPRSVWIKGMSLLESPIARGLASREIAFPEHVGHMTERGEGWEMVAMEVLPGGTPVARDEAGEVLGVLSQRGAGRTAVLGFGPEQEKYFAKPELGPAMLDNLLTWLLAAKMQSRARPWSNRIAVAVPARAEITSVEMNGVRVPDFRVTRVGSVREVELDVDGIHPGEEGRIHVAYRPLPEARNVQTIIHLPWGTMRAAAESPARLADYLKWLNATTCQPLLRGSNGQAWYRGMPEDRPDDKLVTRYQGNFLADLTSECHQRGIKVVGGVYFDNATPVRQHPEVKQLDANGQEKQDNHGSPYACFNNPKGQEHNLATIEQLCRDYDIDGVILDDNYELDWYVNNCFCEYCEQGFRSYCEARGIPYRPPSEPDDYSRPGPRHEYRREATRALASKVRAIAHNHGRVAGGWVSVTMDATHLAQSFDFLGGMAYTSPPRSARAVLRRLGECDFICLLWAPQASAEMIRREVREAIHAGCASVGFWVMGPDGGYELDPERGLAVREALASVEAEWLSFYRDRLLSGDARFALLEGRAGPNGVTLRVRNTGAKVNQRVQGPLSVELAP